jgi:hypothetical protein
MKPRLTVLLGSGSTTQFYRDRDGGTPSTDRLTNCICQMRYPAVVRRGYQIVFGDFPEEAREPSELVRQIEFELKKFSEYPELVPVVPLLHRALSTPFEKLTLNSYFTLWSNLLLSFMLLSTRKFMTHTAPFYCHLSSSRGSTTC